MREREINTLSLNQIISSGGRELNMEVVAQIAESITLFGLQSPISVIADDKEFRIISGRHRLAAVRSLGRAQIETLIYRGLSDIEVRLAEIVENLHRAELTVIQRAEQVTEYANLVRGRQNEGAVQVGQHPSNVKGASGREAGHSATARDLGLPRHVIRRADTISNMLPETKAAAIEAGLGDNQTALMKIAAAPEEQQQAVITKIAAKKDKKKSGRRIGRTVNETINGILAEFSNHDIVLIMRGLSSVMVQRDEEESILAELNEIVPDADIHHSPLTA